VLSLLKYSNEIKDLNPRTIRLDFTLETAEEVQKALTAFVSTFYQKDKAEAEISDYTTGHFKRGVE
jgi:putative protease